MDVNSARYLVSALIQAIAVAWALILTIYLSYHRFIKDIVKKVDEREYNEAMIKDLKSVNILKGVKRSPEGQKFVEGITSLFKKTTKRLKVVNILSMATIIIGIFSLLSIDDNVSFEVGFPSILIILTILFAILSFGSIAILVNGFLVEEIY